MVYTARLVCKAANRPWRSFSALQEQAAPCLDLCVLQALNNNPATPGAWDAIHALSYHTYATDFNTIVSHMTSLHQQFGKPIWVTEIASGQDSSMEQNIALMNQFVPWANSQSWVERYFWNQAVSSCCISLQLCCGIAVVSGYANVLCVLHPMHGSLQLQVPKCCQQCCLMTQQL